MTPAYSNTFQNSVDQDETKGKSDQNLHCLLLSQYILWYLSHSESQILGQKYTQERQLYQNGFASLV